MLGKGMPAPYDLIFIDPPYGRNLLAASLKAILRYGWLKEGGLLNAEVEGGLKFDPEQASPELTVEADRRYGQTRLVLWSRKKKAAQFTRAPLTL